MMNVNLNPPEWTNDAKCANEDPETFFPTPGDNATTTRALWHCKHCPVRTECLDAALSLGSAYQYGVWGGTTQTERLVMLREGIINAETN